ncbi:glycoside hydrolase family 79 protein [Mycena amicta]|nr:glycoside hydrolase family 79 protein [Mycena amicta]
MVLPAFATVCLSVVFVSSVHAQTLSISVPASAPAAAPTLSPSLFSLSIEQDTWTDWAGTTSPNTYLVNVLNNLKHRTGEPPWFRIGADSEDRTDFNPALEFSEIVPVAPTAATPYQEAAEVIVGDGFYQAASHLPSGTRVVWGVNLLHQNTTAAFLEAKSIQKAFKSPAMRASGVTLEFIEIGNEPDLYTGKLNYTSANWNVSAFVAQWTEFATNLTDAGIVTAGSGPKYYGPSFAGVSNAATGFSPLGIFNGGILGSPAGSLLKTYSAHHYQCGAGEILTDIVVKSNVRSNLTQLSPAIAVAHSHGLDYVLGETNSCFGHGAVNTSNVGGIAIWTLDYTLFAGTLGITRAFFHQGIGYKYNAIQPVTLTRSTIDASPLSTPLPPHVQPAYHAALVAAEAIGTSGCTTAVELDIADDQVSGYAFYEEGALKRAVLISHKMFFAGSGAARGVKNISLSSGQDTVLVKRLFIPSADATTGLVWAGQSFDAANGKASGDVVVEKASVGDISLSDTEIVLVSF